MRILRSLIFLLALCRFLDLPMLAQEGKVHQISLAFTGDIMGHDSQISAAFQEENGSYDYDTCFSYLRNFFQEADLVVGNLEVTLAGEPYKGYPQFSSPDALALALKKNGFNTLVQANNHAFDRGKQGLERTLEVLDLLEFRHTGTFRDSTDRTARHPLLLEKDSFRIALLNYSYGTNGLVVTHPNIVNLIDKNTILQDLARAEELNPDAIIACMHWGAEYETQPNKEQKELAGFLFENGTDIIIGSHPHVIQPMERRESDGRLGENLVVWSMGNFISNQRNRGTDGGAVIRITLEKQDGICRMKEASYLLTWVYTPRVKEKKEFYVLPAAEFGHDQSLIRTKEDQEKIRLFLDDARNLLKNYNTGVNEILFPVR